MNAFTRDVVFALPKGELGKFVQGFFERYGFNVTCGDKKPRLLQIDGERQATFRTMGSRDVAKRFFPGTQYAFGITGNDVLRNEKLGGDLMLGEAIDLSTYAKQLGYDALLGSLVLMGREDALTVSDSPTVVVTEYYPNIAEAFLERTGVRDYNLLVVQGATEGYLSSGEADFGIDTYFTGGTMRAENEYLKSIGLAEIKVLETLMGVYPVFISAEGNSFEDFKAFAYQYKYGKNKKGFGVDAG